MKLAYVAALVGAAGVTLGAAMFVAGGTMSGTTAAATPAPVVAVATTTPVPQRHTLEDMMGLPDGISYDDAARRLGTPGHSEGRRLAVDTGFSQGGNAAVYAWPNPDGSRVLLIFQHDRLVHRTHEGLR